MNKKNKKILFLVFSLGKGGGTERVIVDQLNNLDKKKFDLSLCTLSNKVELEFLESIKIPKENKKIFNFHSLFDISEWFSFVSWLRKENFDVIYSHLFFANFVGRISGGVAGVERIIATEHNVYLNRGFLERSANRVLAKISYRIVAVSNSVRDYLVKYEKINSEKIIVIYNGVDLDKYNFNSDARNNLREEFGLKGDDFAVLSIGQVNIQKNYDLIIDIAREITKGGGNIKFFIAGGDHGKLADELKGKIREFGLENKISFLGVRDDVPSLLSSTDLLLMPSRWEGFGLALVEAMANGKPVVVNNIDTLREIVGENNEYGIVATKLEEFYNIITKFKEDKEFYKKYASLSLQRAKDFSLDKNIKKLSDLL